jgi:hypothetical protein
LALQPARRAHEQRLVLDDEIAPLDELDAHLARQERVLEVRRVVHAGREHRLSSRTRKSPAPSRTRSMPATWIPYVPLGPDPAHLAMEVPRRDDEPTRDDPVLQDPPRTVGVTEKRLEREHALTDTAFDDLPLVRRDDAGHQVQRERALLARELEGDALVTEGPVTRRAPVGEVGRRQRLERFVERQRVAARVLGRGEQLVERRDRLVARQEVTHAGDR